MPGRSGAKVCTKVPLFVDFGSEERGEAPSRLTTSCIV